MSKQKSKILIVDDEEKIRTILGAILRDEGYEIQSAKDGIEAIEKCKEFQPHLAIIDLQMPRMDGIETSRRLKDLCPLMATIILTAHGSIQSAVQAIKEGVYDYATKPFDNDQIVAVIKRGVEHARMSEEIEQLRRELGKQYGTDRILGESAAMQRVRKTILQIADMDATVLIGGESGTGKELAARAIHHESRRKKNPLVIIDCTAIPPSLIESEFFGHEKGSFTDARERQSGKFEEADTGTIFLDEIGELPLDAQTKLLRVIQEKEFTRIGSSAPVKVDARIIAATNKNLEQEVQEKRFREDLFYRLNVLKLQLPALRDHAEDIPTYVKHFIGRYAPVFRKTISGVTDEAMVLLKGWAWKGNIRELENTIQRAMLNAAGGQITAADIEFPGVTGKTAVPLPRAEDGLELYIRSLTEQHERKIILDTLRETNGNRTAAAAKLRISRKTLFNKLQQLGIVWEESGE